MQRSTLQLANQLGFNRSASPFLRHQCSTRYITTTSYKFKPRIKSFQTPNSHHTYTTTKTSRYFSTVPKPDLQQKQRSFIDMPNELNPEAVHNIPSPFVQKIKDMFPTKNPVFDNPQARQLRQNHLDRNARIQAAQDSRFQSTRNKQIRHDEELTRLNQNVPFPSKALFFGSFFIFMLYVGGLLYDFHMDYFGAPPLNLYKEFFGAKPPSDSV